MTVLKRMLGLLMTLAILVLPLSGNTQASVIQVPTDFTTIQSACDSAVEGDTVLVAEGLYQENISISTSITLASSYLYVPDSTYVLNTIITAMPPGRAITVDSTVGQVRIIGFTFENCEYLEEYGSGAAIYADNTELSLEACVFRLNLAVAGAVFMQLGDLSITGCSFISNQSTLLGPAVTVFYSTLECHENTFNDNMNTYIGGALSISQTNAVISNNSFISNQGVAMAGAIQAGSSDPASINTVIISHNEFFENVAGQGGALWAYEVDTLLVFDNVFRANTAFHPEFDGSAGAVKISEGNGYTELWNNEFYYNSAPEDAGVINISSSALFHHNLLFRNSGRNPYTIGTIPSATLPQIQVFRNLFYQNTWLGSGGDFGAIAAKHNTTIPAYENDFYGNHTYAAGVNPYTIGTLNIINNYWGDPSGPFHPSQNPIGLGDAVMEAVDVLPYSDTPFTTRWLQAPEPLMLIAPTADDFLNDDSVTFLWHTTADSTPHDTLRYALELADNPEFDDRIVIETDTDTSVTVNDLEWEELYYWRVLARDIYDLSTYSSETRSFIVTTVNDGEQKTLPQEWAIKRVYPNPFNRAVQVTLSAPPSHEDIHVVIYDLQGRLVTTLYHGTLTPGIHSFVWQPQSATGIYLLNISTGSWQETRKIAYLK